MNLREGHYSFTLFLEGGNTHRGIVGKQGPWPFLLHLSRPLGSPNLEPVQKGSSLVFLPVRAEAQQVGCVRPASVQVRPKNQRFSSSGAGVRVHSERCSPRWP